MVGGFHASDSDRQAFKRFAGARGPTGDAALLKVAERVLAMTGAKVVGAEAIVPEILAGEGLIAGPAPDPALLSLLAFAMEAARDIGRQDVGQAAIVAAGRVVATEDREGTDALLARVASRPRGSDQTREPMVLAKALKPQQSLLSDRPALGPQTIRGAATAGISAVTGRGQGCSSSIGFAAIKKRWHVNWASPSSASRAMPAEPLSLFVLAGEASGDRIGGALIAGLRQRTELRVTGVGGPEMAAAGLLSIFPMSDLSVMGYADVVKRLPLLFYRLFEAQRSCWRRTRPDDLFLIDSQVFSATLARRLRRSGYRGRIVLYVAPAVWAWKPERAPGLKELFDEVLAVLPFEPAAMARLGGPPTRYVGHPALALFRQRPVVRETLGRCCCSPAAGAARLGGRCRCCVRLPHGSPAIPASANW